MIVITVVIPITTAQLEDEKSLNVYILAGQSNAAYSEKEIRCNPEYVNETLEAPHTKLWYYGTEEMPIRNGISSSTPSIYDPTFQSYSLYEMYRNGSWVIGGEEANLAYNLSKSSNKDILIINTGVENQKISELLPTATQGIYVKNVIDHALDCIDRDKYPIVNFYSVIWIQGESDNVNNTPIENYKNDFKTLQSFYSDYGFNSWVIVKTRPLYHDVAAIAQQQLANELNNVKITDIALAFSVNEQTMATDNVHYTQKGRSIVADTVSSMVEQPVKNFEVSQLMSLIPVVLIAAIIISVAIMAIKPKLDMD